MEIQTNTITAVMETTPNDAWGTKIGSLKVTDEYFILTLWRPYRLHRKIRCRDRRGTRDTNEYFFKSYPRNALKNIVKEENQA